MLSKLAASLSIVFGWTTLLVGCGYQQDTSNISCQEGSKRCQDQTMETCLAGLWRIGTDCARLEQQCRKGQCQPFRICEIEEEEKATLQCDENQVEQCINNIWTRTKDCGLAVQICHKSECKNQCETDQGRCMENMLEKCENGIWVHDRDCANSGEVCLDGACQKGPECEGSELRCQLDLLEQCMADSFQLLQDCSLANKICLEARCQDKPAEVKIRPWEGEWSRLRYLDLRAASDLASKVCIFGVDGDPRPYQVSYAQSLDPGQEVVIQKAIYDFGLPKGVELWAHWLNVALLADNEQPTTQGCDIDQASLLVSSDQLEELDNWHTLVLAGHAANTTCTSCCQEDSHLWCDYFPRSSSSQPIADCAQSRLYVLTDGTNTRFNWSAGYRFVNLSNNSHWLSRSISTEGSMGGWEHFSSLEPGHVFPYYSFKPEEVSDPNQPQVSLRICPSFLKCLTEVDENFDYRDLYETSWTCPAGNPDWIIAETNTDRLTKEKTFTTFYLVGNVAGPTEDYSRLQEQDVTLVVAHDVANDPLP